MQAKVSIIMGSTSDLPIMEDAAKFLNEMEIFYKHSVENWRHAFKRIVEATDEIRQENELDD